MKTIAKSAIVKGRDLVYSSDPSFAGYALRYPLKEIPKCHYEAKITKKGAYPHVMIDISAELIVFDTRTGHPFLYPFSHQEEADILDEEDGEGVGYIIEGSSIDLDELCLLMISSSLPLRLLEKEDEPFSEGIPGVSFGEDETK